MHFYCQGTCYTTLHTQHSLRHKQSFFSHHFVLAKLAVFSLTLLSWKLVRLDQPTFCALAPVFQHLGCILFSRLFLNLYASKPSDVAGTVRVLVYPPDLNQVSLRTDTEFCIILPQAKIGNLLVSANFQ